MQVQTLKRNNWNVIKLYSINFFNNPKREIKKIKEYLDRLCSGGKTVASGYKRPYRAAKLEEKQVDAQYILSGEHDAEIIRAIKAVVAAEEPISAPFLIKRVLSAYGIFKHGVKLEAKLNSLIEGCGYRHADILGTRYYFRADKYSAFDRYRVEEGVQLVTTGAGNPGKYVPAWKEAGIKVFPVVAAPILAKRLERYGVDGFIAEGTESGGHVGEMTTMALVPQVVDAVSVPVVAAGGIADGRQLTAAFALGACGVQMGTCLLASEECPIHENYKQAVLKAGANDTVVTGRSTGAPVRVLKNRRAQEYLQLEKTNPPLAELEKLTLGSLRRAVFDGDLDTGSFMSGQVAGMVHEIRPLRQIFEDLMADYERVRKGLSE